MEDQSKALTVFNFEEQEIRTVMADGKIWFVAADVCKALGIGNVSLAVNGNPTREDDGLDNDEKGIYNVNTLRGLQEMLCVNESGLQELIWKSRKPKAKAFKRWVKRDVIPSIATTGVYDPAGQLAAMQEEILQLRQRVQGLIPERVTDQQFVEVLGQFKTMVHEKQLGEQIDDSKRSNLEFALEKAKGYMQGLRVQHFDLTDPPNEYGEVRIKEYPDDKLSPEAEKQLKETRAERLIMDYLDMYFEAQMRDLVAEVGLSTTAVKAIVNNLIHSGFLKKVTKQGVTWYLETEKPYKK